MKYPALLLIVTMAWIAGKTLMHENMGEAGVEPRLAAASDLTSPTYRRTRASWFGPGLYGNRMACGWRLYRTTNAVAHKTLPCGTRLHICFHGRCAYTTVQDRGPFVSGREFDLAAGLARQLRFTGHGVGTILVDRPR